MNVLVNKNAPFLRGGGDKVKNFVVSVVVVVVVVCCGDIDIDIDIIIDRTLILIIIQLYLLLVVVFLLLGKRSHRKSPGKRIFGSLCGFFFSLR